MKRKLIASLIFLVVLSTAIFLVFDFTEADTEIRADSLHVAPDAERSEDYDENAADSLEIYKELISWTKKNADFPYAGAYIDEQGTLNIRVEGLNDEHRLHLTDLFGDDVIVRDADATFKQLEEIYIKLKEEIEEFKEKDIPIAGFYISEIRNKVVVELSSDDSDYINDIKAVIGDYPYVYYEDITESFGDGYNYTGTIIRITKGASLNSTINDRAFLLVDTNEDSEMNFGIDHRTELVELDIDDLEVGDQVKILAPYLIEEMLPPKTLAARIALDE